MSTSEGWRGVSCPLARAGGAQKGEIWELGGRAVSTSEGGGGRTMRAGGAYHVDDDVVLETDILDHLLGHPRPHHVDVHHVEVHLRENGARRASARQLLLLAVFHLSTCAVQRGAPHVSANRGNGRRCSGRARATGLRLFPPDPAMRGWPARGRLARFRVCRSCCEPSDPTCGDLLPRASCTTSSSRAAGHRFHARA